MMHDDDPFAEPCALGPFRPSPEGAGVSGPTRLSAEMVTTDDGDVAFVGIDPETGRVVESGFLAHGVRTLAGIGGDG